MGKVASKLSRQTVQKFNVENRARRVIEKGESFKPIVAPKHATTVEPLKQFQEEHPELLDAQKTKHEGLDERLKGMIVDPNKFGELKTKRSLPENRKQVEDPEFGYLEPAFIRPGYFSIRQGLDFISRHVQSPTTYTADHAASEYKLDPEATKDVLRYFATFQVQFPQEVLDKMAAGGGSDESLLSRPKQGKLLTGNLNKEDS